MIQKLLDELVRDGTLNVQEYGKAKIYYANQVRPLNPVKARARFFSACFVEHRTRRPGERIVRVGVSHEMRQLMRLFVPSSLFYQRSFSPVPLPGRTPCRTDRTRSCIP